MPLPIETVQCIAVVQPDFLTDEEIIQITGTGQETDNFINTGKCTDVPGHLSSRSELECHGATEISSVVYIVGKWVF